MMGQEAGTQGQEPTVSAAIPTGTPVLRKLKRGERELVARTVYDQLLLPLVSQHQDLLILTEDIKAWYRNMFLDLAPTSKDDQAILEYLRGKLKTNGIVCAEKVTTAIYERDQKTNRPDLTGQIVFTAQAIAGMSAEEVEKRELLRWGRWRGTVAWYLTDNKKQGIITLGMAEHYRRFVEAPLNKMLTLTTTEAERQGDKEMQMLCAVLRRAVKRFTTKQAQLAQLASPRKVA